MPLIGTKAAASSQGFGQFAESGAEPVYIEDVFSTYLYTGTGSTQTITNGIDLAGEGGLVWIKLRSTSLGFTFTHALFDTERGVNQFIRSDGQTANTTYNNSLTAFNSNGFSLGTDPNTGLVNYGTGTNTYASWTFRKQPKFFDVVTYTGDGSNRTIAHDLGSVPGCIIVKRTDTAGDWQVYHRANTANPETDYLVLNSTAATVDSNTRWNDTLPTATVFSLGTEATVNASGGTYVAYLFAHDAGGFGLTGTDNVISCGSYTTSSTSDSPIISLGYEPQLVLVKLANTAGDWRLFDNMRGVATGGVDALLRPNSSAAESSNTDYITFNSTGFQQSPNIDTGANTYIYIAIRRGPMKVPTSGTSVFGLNARTGTGANATVTGSAGVSDAVLIKNRGSAVGDLFASRLTGTGYLETSSNAAEVTAGTTILQANPWDVMDGVKVGTTSTITNASANTYINYLFDRAPGFFDVVCYTGTGVARTVNHNLAAVPELLIVKRREGAGTWWTYSTTTGATKGLQLNLDSAETTSSLLWNNTAPTSSVFTVGTGAPNGSTFQMVAYLFATVAGVSKVGSYTSNGATQTINCGFTAGARFVLIKRTDSTGDWYVWDTARGIVTTNDPYLLLNSTAAEVTNTDFIDPDTTGFIVSQAGSATINVNGGTYIFLAIA